MNPAEQEALFLKVRERFPDFTARWASGYVHGVVDEGEMAMPPREYRKRLDHYAEGYLRGFMDARGEDCLGRRWARKYRYTQGVDLAFRWWWEGRR